jgi:transposase
MVLLPTDTRRESVKQSGLQAVATSSLPELPESLWQRLTSLIGAAEPGCDPAQSRLLLQALLYRQLTGAPWAATPVVDPLVAEATYWRWWESGLLAQLTEVLRIRLDDE